MGFNCRHCGTNAFKLVTETAGHVTATCTRCGGATPFQKSAMAEEPSQEPAQMHQAAVQ
jgi:transcription elongation factor Elf1